MVCSPVSWLTRGVVSSDSMKKATATSHGSSFLEASEAGGEVTSPAEGASALSATGLVIPFFIVSKVRTAKNGNADRREVRRDGPKSCSTVITVHVDSAVLVRVCYIRGPRVQKTRAEMNRFEQAVYGCMKPTAKLLERTTKPLHRAILLNFWRHVHLEGAGEYHK